MGLRDLGGVFAIGLLGLYAFPANAQSSADRALAEALFDEGQRLMKEKNYAEGCEKLAESQRLDPATGTLLNLAACREAEGKLATAWVLYGEAASSARRDSRPDRVDYANERIKELEPKLSRLSVEVPPAAIVEGMNVTLDGTPLRKAAWGVPAAVDPGAHEIKVEAPGRKTWSTAITVGTNADRQRVTVPVLEPLPSGGAAPAPAPGTPPAAATPAPAPPESDRGGHRPLGVPVLVAGGATLLLTGGALVTGAMALGRTSDFNDANDDPTKTVSERQSLRDDAQSMQVVSTIFTGAAIVGAGVTVALFVTRPANQTARTLVVGPWVTAEGAGLGIGGTL